MLSQKVWFNRNAELLAQELLIYSIVDPLETEDSRAFTYLCVNPLWSQWKQKSGQKEKKRRIKAWGCHPCPAAFIQVRISNIQLQGFFCHTQEHRLGPSHNKRIRQDFLCSIVERCEDIWQWQVSSCPAILRDLYQHFSRTLLLLRCLSGSSNNDALNHGVAG